MNGIDPELDREYAKQLAEEEAEKRRAYLDSLPKSWVMGLDGSERKYVPETKKYPMPDFPPDWQNLFEQKKKSSEKFLERMTGYTTYQRIPQEVLYSKEYIEERLRKQKEGPKKHIGLDDVDPWIKEVSYK